jgi:hypothetical protein
MENTVKAAQLNNEIIEQVLNATVEEPEQPVQLTSPSDTTVNLPAGYVMASGEVARTAEVRELTGKDEELIGKGGGAIKAYATILRQATVSIGGEPVTEQILDSLIIGDRDAIVLGIYKATFGNNVELPGFCGQCSEFKSIAIDIDRDVPIKVLVDPIKDRTFEVEGKTHKFLVTLPTGILQKEIASIDENNNGEKNTLLLKNSILEIDGKPVLGKAQIQSLGIMDRNKVALELSNRLPGPQFDDLFLPCDQCDGEVVVPFNLGALFRF